MGNEEEDRRTRGSRSTCSSGPGRFYPRGSKLAKSGTLLPIIEEKVIPASICFTDSFKAYDTLDVAASNYMQSILQALR